MANIIVIVMHALTLCLGGVVRISHRQGPSQQVHEHAENWQSQGQRRSRAGSERQGQFIYFITAKCQPL